jgi:hypothetical protein
VVLVSNSCAEWQGVGLYESCPEVGSVLRYPSMLRTGQNLVGDCYRLSVTNV